MYGDFENMVLVLWVVWDIYGILGKQKGLNLVLLLFSCDFGLGEIFNLSEIF